MKIIEILLSLVTLLFLARFLLQACRADFYNPISQGIVKATDPVCKPLRLALKPIGNLDLASILVAWLICVAGQFLLFFLLADVWAPILPTLWNGMIKMLLVLMQFYTMVIVIVAIASFIVQGPAHPGLMLLQQLLEPFVGPIRKVLPSLGGLDLSPLVLFIIIILVEDILMRSFF